MIAWQRRWPGNFSVLRTVVGLTYALSISASAAQSTMPDPTNLSGVAGTKAQESEKVDPREPEQMIAVSPNKNPAGDEVSQYLWSVYQRSAAKRDSHGDFTWKDGAAAGRSGFTVEEYVIGGMDPDFRELLFHAGRAMDAAGIDWTILSAFRDDYRQNIAAGFKAHDDNSFHGGSAATGGYGHGCAADLTSSDALLSTDIVGDWFDKNGGPFGLYRPLPRIDPAHVQPRGQWHQLAATLREGRIGGDQTPSGAFDAELGHAIAAEPKAEPSAVSWEQLNCVRPQLKDGPNEIAVNTHHTRWRLSRAQNFAAVRSYFRSPQVGKPRLAYATSVRHAVPRPVAKMLRRHV
jgi:hypothetical protein